MMVVFDRFLLLEGLVRIFVVLVGVMVLEVEDFVGMVVDELGVVVLVVMVEGVEVLRVIIIS